MVSAWDDAGNACEIRVSGAYNPDILDDVQTRVARMYREMVHTNSDAEGVHVEVSAESEDQEQDS